MGVLNKDIWHKEVRSIRLRNAVQPRRWGMFVTVTHDDTPANNTTWVLVQGLASENRNDNDNWQKFREWVQSLGATLLPGTAIFDGDGSSTEFILDDANELIIQSVYVGGQRYREGVDYTKNDFTKTVTISGEPVPAGVGIDVEYWYYKGVPVNTTPPSISGTGIPGQVLTADPGTWTNAPNTYRYQWKRNGQDIKGSTGSTFVVTESDDGVQISVSVTAINAIGSATATSQGVPIGIDLDTFFDELNLQSNTSENLVAISGRLSQWNDLSPAGRNAVQNNNSNRPFLNGLEPTFAGANTFMSFDEFASNKYSLYLVVKATAAITGIAALMGGQTASHYIYINASKLLRVDNSASDGGSVRSVFSYGDEYYMVLSIRRSGGAEVIGINNRKVYSTAPSNSVVQYLAKVGDGIGRWPGIIRAVCLHSECLDDATDQRVVEALFDRYSLPEISNALVGFGDSITLGIGATTPLTDGWLTVLATQLDRPRKNFGIGGSRLTAFDETSGVSRYESQVIERPYSDTILILYGTNDVVAGVSGDDYQSALSIVLNGLISAGYSKSKLFVGTVPYQAGDANAVAISDYNARIASVCSNLGLPAPADVYSAMKNGGGDSLMADSLHPNDSGHAVIAGAFADVIN